MANELSPWIDRLFGIVDCRAVGGQLAFPGVMNGETVANASRLLFNGIPNAGLPILAKVDTSPNTAFPKLNRGWDFCMLGVAGDKLIDPVGMGKLPKWDPASTRSEFSKWEQNLFEHLQLVNNETRTPRILDARRRLEGVVGFLDEASGDVNWDFVRIFRVKNALAEPGPDGTLDWMAYKFSPLRGNEDKAQEGGGHGPPEIE